MMFILLVLTLASFCFVGFTFAIYSSSGEGYATVQVAKWEINVNGGKAESGSTTLKVTKVSPSKEPYSETGVRINDSGTFEVATITNNSDVAAAITISVDTEHMTITTVENPSADYNEVNARKPFSVKFSEDAEGTKEIVDNFTLEAGASKYIYAIIVWKSDELEGVDRNGDENDTMIAHNVKSLNWTVSYSAVQASEVPNNGETPTTP